MVYYPRIFSTLGHLLREPFAAFAEDSLPRTRPVGTTLDERQFNRRGDVTSAMKSTRTQSI